MLVEGADHRGGTAAGHDFHHEEVAHHDRDHEDGNEGNAAFRHRDDDEAHDVEAAGAGIERRLTTRLSMRASELKIGTTMKIVSWWT